MRKLLFVLLVFILSIFSLLLLFNTLTNTSRQTNIAPAKNIQMYVNKQLFLRQAIQLQTTPDSNANRQFEKFNNLVQSRFPLLFNNPNVQWQNFGKYSSVAKWIGRTPDLAPIVLVASPAVETPNLEYIPEWSYNPFLGKATPDFIYGAGSQGGKSAAAALLTVFQQFVDKKVLPNRTTYFVFPKDETEELEIITALQEAQAKPEFILHTGGLIADSLLWDISSPTALIGIGCQAKANIHLEVKNKQPLELLQSLVNNLQTSLPSIPIENKVLQAFLQDITPEMGFGNRLIFSNKWLLNNMQQQKLLTNDLTSHFFCNKVRLLESKIDSNNSCLATLQITSAAPFEGINDWLKNQLQHPQINLLGEPELIQKQAQTAPIDNHAYRIISSTIKEIFPNTLTAPFLAQSNLLSDSYAAITPNIYYFCPVIYTPLMWQNKQKGIDEKIATKNFEQMMQFYHLLLKNCI